MRGVTTNQHHSYDWVAILFNTLSICSWFCLIYLYLLFLYAKERKPLVLIMNKKLLFLLPLMCLVACSSRGTSSSANSDDTSSPSSNDTSASSDSSSDDFDDETKYGRKTITFKGDASREGMNSGSQIGTEKFTTAVTSLFNKDDGDFLTSIGGAHCSFQIVNTTAMTSLTVGTGSYAGNIIFNFSKNIVKLDFTIQTYHKYDSYHENYSIDTSAEITVEGVQYDMSVSGNTTIPQEQNKSQKLATPKKSVEFSNSEEKHRVYIHELTLTYLK